MCVAASTRIESWLLKRTLAVQRWAVQKTPHPGSWRHFVASRAAHCDARAIRLLRRRERARGRCNEVADVQNLAAYMQATDGAVAEFTLNEMSLMD